MNDERNEVIKACLNMGHIPVGMEMFNIADEEQWAVRTNQNESLIRWSATGQMRIVRSELAL